MVIGLGPFLLLVGIGRLIKGGITPILSGEGLFLKEKLEEQLDGKKEELDKLIKTGEADQALAYFFDELEYILIHKKFNSNLKEV